MKPNLVNPLDELFQTESKSPAVADYVEMTEAQLTTLEAEAPTAECDAADIEIDRKIDAIHDAALETFQQQMQYAEIVEPRYAARNAEVAANYLNIALGAVSTRAKVKLERKKVGVAAPFAGRNPNGTVVASREDILRMIAIDAETRKVE